MPLPNLLATRRGRLTAFFCLYATEGIPLGFAATAVATQLRREGVGPAAIGAFVASFYLPWAFKWAFGPIVDVFGSERLGRRRGWILITQVLMALTLLSTVLLKLPEQLALFTALLLVHNVFGATQDVAIDALACNTLQDDERGLANGLMFAGAMIGQVLGGSGVLFLTPFVGFQSTFFLVAGAILLVTVGVVLPMREPRGEPRPPTSGSRLLAAGAEMHRFALESFRSFLGTRGAFAGVAFALLPAGAMSLSLALQTNLAVELGMDDRSIATLQVAVGVVFAACCVTGGYLSDRVGRRTILAVGIVLMSVPALYLMTQLSRAGWIFPIPLDAPDRPAVPSWLVTSFWIAGLGYAVCNGLMYGVRSAIFMDVTNPLVAATQFTAYMALLNLTTAYTSTWQGIAIEAWGYPRTILADVLFGLVCLTVLPLMRKPRSGEAGVLDAFAPRRARLVAVALAFLCLAWVPYWHWHDAFGAIQPIANTLFTLVFVASAVFLLAGGAVVGDSAGLLARAGACVAPLLLLLAARSAIAPITAWLGIAEDAPWFATALSASLIVVPLVASAILFALATRSWSEMRPGQIPSPSPAPLPT